MIDPAFPILRHFKTSKKTGIEGALDVIEARTGKRPQASAIKQWKYGYKKIPAQHVAPLVFELLKRGISFTEDEFVLRESTPNAQNQRVKEQAKA